MLHGMTGRQAKTWLAGFVATALVVAGGFQAVRSPIAEAVADESAAVTSAFPIQHKRVQVGDTEIFYREAGSPDAPTILLLHGFPTSSQMFRNLIPQLADEFHLIAPDYPGYGNSSMPSVEDFSYTFDNLASIMEDFTEVVGIDSYTLYLMDYGAPIGFRLATAHPDRVKGLIIQNGNAYEEGLREFWDPFRVYWANPSETTAAPLREFLKVEATEWQYTHGTRNPERISPDTWTVDQYFLDRPGNQDIQLQLFLDYRSNPPLYPTWQAYMREYQPPALLVWGKNDVIFPAEGAYPYQQDLETLEFYLLDTGHFALEEDGEAIASHIRSFMQTHIRD